MTASIIASITEKFQGIERNGDEIEITSFLTAVEPFLAFFDMIGNVTFKPLKMDFEGNMKKLRKEMEANPAPSLEAMLARDVNDKKNDALAPVSLLWLRRGMEFLEGLLKGYLDEAGGEMGDHAKATYEAVLKPYHGFVVRKVFGAGMGAVPKRATLHEKIVAGRAECDPKGEVGALLAEFSPVVKHLKKVFVDMGLESTDKV
ncbi:Glycolipid transfer protein (GLTP) [Carpediemonas membranifera]|uniref:Glycolipid transfer protein (GLTP) n=1 Tax=Carpediemonas membranifera TaxID=201153 RepID=A0A8J6E5W7_9EUKA|nr:Glycolipid transfer protein (GLTP) [Carpediemonas membranifera]|eukprot:KAG9396412.1 Glycolipid transfer protein (GLTP) [Carpediemonas membranifera]